MGRYALSMYFGHDTSLALVGEGKIVHLEHERFTRRKHDNHFPRASVDRLLAEALRIAGVTFDEVTVIVEIGCGDHLNSQPRNRKMWTRNLVAWDSAETTFLGPKVPCHYVPHHLAHAAYGFYTSEHEKARMVALDGGGDAFLGDSGGARSITAAAGIAKQAFGESEAAWSLEVVSNLEACHVGSMWAGLATAYCRDEFAAGTIMAMAGVSEASFSREVGLSLEVKRAIEVLQEKTTSAFHDLADDDAVAEGGGVVCMAGGCALNGVAAYDLLQRTDVRAVHVPPAVHDGGLTVGAALFGLHAILGEPRRRYSTSDVAFAGYTDASLEGELPADVIMEHLVRGRVVALANGRAESGPRALGHRSFLAAPTRDLRDRLNDIKGRKRYRPAAPVVLREHADKYFCLKNADCYGYMTMIAEAKPLAFEEIPGAIHADGTARVQVVDEDSSLGPVVRAFYERTGVPALLNTSFNLGGEAMVNDAAQARDTFSRSSADVLVIGGSVAVNREA